MPLSLRIRKARRNKWPLSIEALIPFSPASGAPKQFAVHYLDYTALRVLLFINSTNQKFVLKDLVVNHQFRPPFGVDGLSDPLYPLRFPLKIDRDTFFSAVLQSSAVASGYPRLPRSVVLSTDRGGFVFNACKLIRPGFL